MSWVSGKNIYLGKAYVDWLAVSEWLCNFFKLWEGKNDCLCPYILPLKPNFKRFSPKFIQKWAAKLEKLPKNTPWVAWNSICHRYTTPYNHRIRKSKMKDFLENRPFWANSFTKILGRFWPKNASKRRKKARNRPRSIKKRFFDPKLHLDPIWNRFRSNELQNMKMLCPPPYSDVLDAASLSVIVAKITFLSVFKLANNYIHVF